MTVITPRVAKALGLAPGATGSQMLARIEQLKAAKNEVDPGALVERAITFAIDSRRLLRSQRPWAEAYARSDPHGFLELIAAMPEVGYASATEEFRALTRLRVEQSGRKLEFTAALARVISERPSLRDDVRAELLFTARRDVDDDEILREVARRHPAVLERARELVAASGMPIDVGEAQRQIANEHPELVEEIRRDRRGVAPVPTPELEQFRARVADQMAAGIDIEDAQRAVAVEDPELYRSLRSTAPRVESGAATQEFRRAVEDIVWADGVSWDQAARRVHASRPELSRLLALEREGTA